MRFWNVDYNQILLFEIEENDKVVEFSKIFHEFAVLSKNGEIEIVRKSLDYEAVLYQKQRKIK